MLGRFLEFTVATPDILASLSFYKQLGFHELEGGDVWPHKYAVVSDGEVCIGLHERALQSPALTFVHQEVAKEARSMADRGFEFSYLQIDDDSFNELGFLDNDGHLITFIEARTFSKPDEDMKNSLCGRWFETTLPVRDTVRAGLFWAPLAPKLLRMREEPTTHMRFEAAGMPLGLSESIALSGASLCFRCDSREEIWIALAKHGFKHKEFPGFEGAFMSLEAPEGTTLYLFDEDFLGELYEVDETDQVPPA
jgi:catechol 2,3-dioxygenase-like lactoylglutathione lyase family enzyme